MFLRSLLILLILFCAITAGNAKDSPDLQVSFYKGRLNVTATGIPLSELLREIGKKSGIKTEVGNSELANDQVTIAVTNQPLDEALDRILQSFNYLLSYDGKRLAGVVVLSRKQNSQPDDTATPTPQAAAPPPNFGELVKRNLNLALQVIARALRGNLAETKSLALDSLRSVNDPRALALLGEALGDSDSNVKRVALGILMEKNSPEALQILTTALKDPNPSFRIEILQALADKGQTQALKSALSDQNRQVRETAKALLESQEQR